MADGCHHGDLRDAVRDAAISTVGESGPHALSLRGPAKRVGVAHTRHCTISAASRASTAKGFDLLADALANARTDTGSFLETGVAHVRFARDEPAYFAVMFQPDLFDAGEPELVRAFGELTAGIATPADNGLDQADAAAAVIAAWSMVHGIATLALTGNLDAAGVRRLGADGDLLGITRRAAGLLTGSH